MSNMESVLQEHRHFDPPKSFVDHATLKKADVDRLHAEAARDFEGYWARLARENLAWHKPFTKVLDESNAPFYRWFHDGELSASYNCLTATSSAAWATRRRSSSRPTTAR